VPEGSWVDLRFVGGAGEPEEIEAEIMSIFRDLTDPTSEVAESASAAELELPEMRGAQAKVTKEAKGFGPVVILIAISVPAATHIVNQLWDDVIWPRIKKKLGADTLGRREDKG
jgi:hypothetical protein